MLLTASTWLHRTAYRLRDDSAKCISNKVSQSGHHVIASAGAATRNDTAGLSKERPDFHLESLAKQLYTAALQVHL